MMNTVVMTQSPIPANIVDIITRTLNTSNSIAKKLLEKHTDSKSDKKEKIRMQLNTMEQDMRNYAMWSAMNGNVLNGNQAFMAKVGEMATAITTMLDRVQAQKGALNAPYFGSDEIRKLASQIRSNTPSVEINHSTTLGFGGNNTIMANANISTNMSGTQTTNVSPAGMVTSASYVTSDGLGWANGNLGSTNITQTMAATPQVPNAFMLGTNSPMATNIYQQANMGMQPGMMNNMMMGTNQMSPMQTQMGMPMQMQTNMMSPQMGMQMQPGMMNQMTMQGQMGMPQQQMMPQQMMTQQMGMPQQQMMPQQMSMQNNGMMMQGGMMPSGM